MIAINYFLFDFFATICRYFLFCAFLLESTDTSEEIGKEGGDSAAATARKHFCTKGADKEVKKNQTTEENEENKTEQDSKSIGHQEIESFER